MVHGSASHPDILRSASIPDGGRAFVAAINARCYPLPIRRPRCSPPLLPHADYTHLAILALLRARVGRSPCSPPSPPARLVPFSPSVARVLAIILLQEIFECVLRSFSMLLAHAWVVNYIFSRKFIKVVVYFS
jgi:hypothetical protein